METERIKEISWRVGSGLLTAGTVAFGCVMFIPAVKTVIQPLHDYLCQPFSWTCNKWIEATAILLLLTLSLLLIKVTFYYRVREQYVEPFLRWFFQWLTKEKSESPRP